jgi:hypothetical protein
MTLTPADVAMFAGIGVSDDTLRRAKVKRVSHAQAKSA